MPLDSVGKAFMGGVQERYMDFDVQIGVAIRIYGIRLPRMLVLFV